MHNQLRKERQSFSAAFRGVYFFLVTERHAWFHLIATMLALCTAWVLSVSPVEWMLITLSIALVWIAEMINTCLERMCNLITTDHHPQIKLIKDIAAGAVLIASLGSLVVGLIIFLPRIIKMF